MKQQRRQGVEIGAWRCDEKLGHLTLLTNEPHLNIRPQQRGKPVISMYRNEIFYTFFFSAEVSSFHSLEYDFLYILEEAEL